MLVVCIHDIIWGIFVIWILFHRYVPVDISSLWQYAIMGLIFYFVRLLPLIIRQRMVLIILCWGICEALLCLLQHGLWIQSNHSFFDVTGSFNNPGPLGGFLGILCAGVIDYIWRRKDRNTGLVLGSLVALLFYGILTSESRAGLLSALTGIIVCLFYQIVLMNRNGHKKRTVITCLVFLFVACIGSLVLYKLKPLSADGRLFVWFNSLHLMAEHPIVGWGSGGWTGNYMLYQADYFAAHPNSQFVMVADNVSCPYNELLHIAVDYGLIGLFLFMWAVIEILRKRQSDCFLESVKVSLLAFLVFSLFSYPFDVTHLLVLWAILMGLLESRSVIQIPLSKLRCRILSIIPVIMLSIISAFLYELHQRSLCDFKLYPYFQYNPDIMYLHVQKEYLDEEFMHRSKILERTAFLFPSSDTYCWLGDDWMKKGNSRKAEYYFHKAADMVPVRIEPCYKLFKLHLSEGDSVAAVCIGKDVLKKKIKVGNTRSLRMRGEINRFLQKIPQSGQ